MATHKSPRNQLIRALPAVAIVVVIVVMAYSQLGQQAENPFAGDDPTSPPMPTGTYVAPRVSYAEAVDRALAELQFDVGEEIPVRDVVARQTTWEEYLILDSNEGTADPTPENPDKLVWIVALKTDHNLDNGWNPRSSLQDMNRFLSTPRPTPSYMWADGTWFVLYAIDATTNTILEGQLRGPESALSYDTVVALPETETPVPYPTGTQQTLPGEG